MRSLDDKAKMNSRATLEKATVGFVVRITGRTGGTSYLALGGIEGPKERAYVYRDAETAKQAGASHQRRWGSANVSYGVEEA
jgi:hypothetical protein